MGQPQDRRQRRSKDPLVALHYQLAATRARAALDAIVVADTSGVVVAGAGSWPVCEELAAYAPLLLVGDDGLKSLDGPPDRGEAPSRVASMRADVEIRALLVGGQEVLLCARRHRGRVSVEVTELDEAAAGISRILESAAA